MSHYVPPELVTSGPPPPKSEEWRITTCKVCKEPYGEHSGDLCAICKRPVEHHDSPDVMHMEIDGLARVATAKLAASLVEIPRLTDEIAACDKINDKERFAMLVAIRDGFALTDVETACLNWESRPLPER